MPGEGQGPRETWGDPGRPGGTQGDLGRPGETWGGPGRAEEVQENLLLNGSISLLRPESLIESSRFFTTGKISY